MTTGGHDAPAGDVTISIITPCYNGAKYIERTIGSALQQSHLPLEIIVIDDGSTDESARIAEGIGGIVRVIRQANQGESVARNRGVAEARGSHLLFLDADDLLAPDALKHLARGVSGKPGVVGLMGCAWFTGDPEYPDRSESASRSAFYPDIIDGNFGPPHCWLVPRALVRKVDGFCETMRWFEDWDMWWRIGLEASGLVSVDYIGARYRQHAQSQLATTSLTNRTRGHAALMTRMTAALLTRPEVLAQSGDRLFWCAWAALTRAKANAVPWSELQPLAENVRGLAMRGPASVQRSLMARAIRWIGVRNAMALQRR
jgi:hypothetical protein